jgi:hypothetical protein
MPSRLPRPVAIAALALIALVAFVAPHANAASPRVSITAQVHSAGGSGTTLRQAGTFRGAPLGSGSATILTTIGAGKGATVAFTLSTPRGTVRGTGDVAVMFKGANVTYRGTARITRGTGAYAGLSVGVLQVSGGGAIAGERFSVRISG